MPASFLLGTDRPAARPRPATLAILFGSVVALCAIPIVARAQSCGGARTPCAATQTAMAPHAAPVHVAPTTDSAAAAPAVDAAAVDEGRKLFHGRGTCYTCHGASLEGSAIAPTLRDHPWKDAKGGSLDAIYQIVTHGVSGTVMVSHPGGISDADARRVATYIWAVSHGYARP